MITLSESEERLVEALRALPPAIADQMMLWATQMRELAKGGSVDWSNTWTGEDMTDATRASLLNLEARETDGF